MQQHLKLFAPAVHSVERARRRGRLIWLSLVLMACVFAVHSGLRAQSDRSGTVQGEKPPDRFAPLEEMRIHYRSYGEGGTAVVFVHGWSCGLDFWRLQVPALNGRVRLILLDLPGHGESDKPQMTYTQDLFARSVDAVLHDAVVNQAILVGHSLGALVVRHYYRRFPSRVAAVVFVDGNLRWRGTREDRERSVAPFRESGYREAADRMIENFFIPETPAALREEIKASMLGTPQHVMVGAMESLSDPVVWATDEIPVPSLGIYKKKNWPADNEQFLRGFIPQLQYLQWDSVGHFVMMERPREFNEALVAFLVKGGWIQGQQ